MLELSENQIQLVTDFTQRLDEEGIRYVILRRHEYLPESVPGTQQKDFDIDLLIDSKSFDQAIDIAFDVGISKKERTSPSLTELTYRGLKNPPAVINKAIKAPKELGTLLIKSGTESAGVKQSRSAYEWTSSNGYGFPLRADGLPLDTKCHLAHKSPLNGSRIRLDPRVEEEMLSNRIQNDSGIYIPSPEDELAHLVTHVVFEYEGELTPYYEERISELVDVVYTVPEKQEHIEMIFSDIFFDAGRFVSERTREKELQGLFEALKRFKDY